MARLRVGNGGKLNWHERYVFKSAGNTRVLGIGSERDRHDRHDRTGHLAKGGSWL